MAKNEFEIYKDQVKLAKQAAISELSSDQNTGNTINYSDLDGWSVVSDSYEGSVQSSTTIDILISMDTIIREKTAGPLASRSNAYE